MRSSPSCKCLLLCFLVLTSSQVLAQAGSSEFISLPWTERRPFQFVDGDGMLKGVLAELGNSIFADAHVPMKWVETPASRTARSLATDSDRICLVGWFRTPEREKVAKISLPIYRDRPQVGIVRADFRIGENRSLRSLVADKTIRLLTKQGYSYGAFLDELIAGRKGGNVDSVVADHGRMLMMVLRQHTDLIFLTREELDFYTARDPALMGGVKAISFKELPAGNQRHILCSRQVPDETMARLDAAIRANSRIKAD